VSPGEVLVEARGVVLTYDDGRRRVRALDGVDLALRRGEFTGLIGPSGSGKSSLLFVLGGLRDPDEGEVRLFGHALPRGADASAGLRRRRIGLLFQEPFLVPFLTVRENALAVCDLPESRARLETVAGAIGLEGLLDERPHRLSGGERQRAGILRALAPGPEVVLADEPTASLDHETGRTVMACLREQACGAALLVVTHDPGMLAGADRVLRIADGHLLAG